MLLLEAAADRASPMLRTFLLLSGGSRPTLAILFGLVSRERLDVGALCFFF
jgi:hypothetical protein